MAYPKMMYRQNGRTRVVASLAEQQALLGTWAESPAAFGEFTAPSAAQTAAYAASVLPLVLAYAPETRHSTVATAVSKDGTRANFATQILVTGKALVTIAAHGEAPVLSART
jgi:hypothetical protein